MKAEGAGGRHDQKRELAMTHDRTEPVIDEVREVRYRISARAEHDPGWLVAYYMNLQAQYRDRLIATPNATDPTDQSAA
jgi:hypothetical protein